jgi:tetratricopeptide (TPR) repeat protein
VRERLEEIRGEISDLQARQRLREVVPLLRRVFELTRMERGSESSAYVAALNELGSLYRTLKELENSEAEFVRAAETEAGIRGKENADYATCINNLAGTYRLKGEHAKAELLFKEAIQIYERELGTEHFVYLSALNNLGLVYQDLKRYEEARVCIEECWRTAEERQAERRVCDHNQQPGRCLHGCR